VKRVGRNLPGWLWGALASMHACALEGPTDATCEAPQKPLAEALYSGSADAGDAAAFPAPQVPIGALVTSNDASVVVCTATVIGAGIGLTAAHCGGIGMLAFRVGETATPVPVRDPIVHPFLDVMAFAFDDTGLPTTQPLALFGGSIGRGWEGELVTLAGVGETETGDTGQLRFVREPIVDVNATEIRVDGMGRSGACGGDSGGPVLIADRDGMFRVAGVLDRGAPSCLGVDVFIKVEAFAEWLHATTGISAAASPCER
jgi:hypothetical protein